MSAIQSLKPETPLPAKERLLIVDDDENVLRSLLRTLRRNGWEIVTATNGEEGLKQVEEARPSVVISDFRMPGMNGLEFLRRVKQIDPHVQRILLTAQADAASIDDAVNRAEVFHFIPKPWSESHLVLTLRTAFEQYRVRSENEALGKLTQTQAEQLRELGGQLEERVNLRTRQLSVAKRQWEMSFDSIDFPLAIVRANDFSLQRANVAYSRTSGKALTELAQAPPCHRYLFNREQPCPGCPLQQSMATETPGRAEISHAGRTYILNVFPMAEEGQAVCSYREVTDERLMTMRFIEAEKMAAVGHLAGGVAHEINNPLGGILAFAQLMKRDAGRNPDDLEALTLIEESALRCKRIVESLLKFSRKSRAEDRRAFDISRCVEDATLLFKAQLKTKPQIQLVVNLGADLPQVWGDTAQLGQVVLNLLQNGMQALPKPEGTLTVETGARGNRVFFLIRDTGTGILPAHLPHIFEPHFTTKPPGEGTGLGLSIAYRIVEDHRGEFEVKSQPDEGTTFTVWLPTLTSGMS